MCFIVQSCNNNNIFSQWSGKQLERLIRLTVDVVQSCIYAVDKNVLIQNMTPYNKHNCNAQYNICTTSACRL